jgi:hypothetical protein
MKKNPIDYVLGMFKKPAPEPVKAEPQPKATRRKRKVKA